MDRRLANSYPLNMGKVGISIILVLPRWQEELFKKPDVQSCYVMMKIIDGGQYYMLERQQRRTNRVLMYGN